MKGKQEKQLISRLAVWFMTISFIVSVGAFLIKNCGRWLVDFVEMEAIPYLLNADDLEMGCAMADSFSLLLPGLKEINASPDRLSILFDFLAGSCAEFKASEQELRYLRAVFNKQILEAQDARIQQKRYLNLAAKRQLKGYFRLQKIFAKPLGTTCPTFSTATEEFYWLVGLMNGLQAVLNDLVSEGSANVPLYIGQQVGRDATCLQNAKWWGLPDAIQASIWINSLSAPPENIDPFAYLERTVQLGLQQGVRVTQIIMAKIYIGLGNHNRVKKIIRTHVSAKQDFPSKHYAFLDSIATAKLQVISDYLWTEATGKRTPIGRLGTFWDDPKEAVDVVDLSDVL